MPPLIHLLDAGVRASMVVKFPNNDISASPLALSLEARNRSELWLTDVRTFNSKLESVRGFSTVGTEYVNAATVESFAYWSHPERS